MILNLPQLLQPIPGGAPCGTDLRSDPAGDIYYRMKDARSTARAAERAADSDAGQSSRPAEWRILIDLAQDALATRTKDLEIAAWLTEAALRLHGFAGLHDCFALIDGLVERYWDGLFSVDSETVSDKVAPLAGLNGVGQDGTLIQPIRLTALTVPSDGAGLWHFMAARRGGPGAAGAQHVVDQALRATDSATFSAIAHDLRGAIAAFAAMTARLDAVCKDESPPSGNIAATLEAAMDMLTEVAGPSLTQAGLLVPDAPAPAGATAPGATGQAPAPEPGALRTRDDALRELGRIAQFFRETEPNSPTAYALDTLVRRARLPLADLVSELIPDETARQLFLTTAGIWPVKPQAPG